MDVDGPTLLAGLAISECTPPVVTIKRRLFVKDPRGLHCRPLLRIIRAAQSSGSVVTLRARGYRIGASVPQEPRDIEFVLERPPAEEFRYSAPANRGLRALLLAGLGENFFDPIDVEVTGRDAPWVMRAIVLVVEEADETPEQSESERRADDDLRNLACYLGQAERGHLEHGQERGVARALDRIARSTTEVPAL